MPRQELRSAMLPTRAAGGGDQQRGGGRKKWGAEKLGVARTPNWLEVRGAIRTCASSKATAMTADCAATSAGALDGARACAISFGASAGISLDALISELGLPSGPNQPSLASTENSTASRQSTVPSAVSRPRPRRAKVPIWKSLALGEGSLPWPRARPERPGQRRLKA